MCNTEEQIHYINNSFVVNACEICNTANGQQMALWSRKENIYGARHSREIKKMAAKFEFCVEVLRHSTN